MAYRDGWQWWHLPEKSGESPGESDPSQPQTKPLFLCRGHGTLLSGTCCVLIVLCLLSKHRSTLLRWCAFPNPRASPNPRSRPPSPLLLLLLPYPLPRSPFLYPPPFPLPTLPPSHQQPDCSVKIQTGELHISTSTGWASQLFDKEIDDFTVKTLLKNKIYGFSQPSPTELGAMYYVSFSLGARHPTVRAPCAARFSPLSSPPTPNCTSPILPDSAASSRNENNWVRARRGGHWDRLTGLRGWSTQ